MDIKKNRFKLIIHGITLIVIFLFSVQLRSFNLNKPIGRHHEWITAHTLMTLQIWERGGGPEHFHFSPVYTYEEQGNKKIGILGGVEDGKGNFYYVSYPSFGFLVPYYSIKLVGAGFSVLSIQVFGLVLHFIIAIVFFILIHLVLNKRIGAEFCFSAWIGYLLYTFSGGNLWFHSNVYFVDVLMQLFFVLLLLFFFIIYKKKASINNYFLFTFFLLVYFAILTEWLAVFLCFCFFLFSIYSWLYSKNRYYFKIALVIALATSCSLATTFYQYSSINTSSAFIEASLQKYKLRSGHEGTEGSEYGFSLTNPESYSYLKEHYKRNYLPIIKLLIGMLVLYIGFSFYRKKVFYTSQQMFIVLISFFSLLLHHLIFFNFNAVHDFSTLKTALFIFLIIVFISAEIENFLNDFGKSKVIIYNVLVFVSVFFLLQESFIRYKRDNNLESINYYNFNIGHQIQLQALADEVVYVNGIISPECMYYASRNFASKPNVKISIEDLKLLRTSDKGIFIRTEGDKVLNIYRFTIAGDSTKVDPF